MNAFPGSNTKPKLNNIAPRPLGMTRQFPVGPPTKAGASSGKKRPRLTSEQRLERSRERNRIHARKTRQRKKLIMTEMQKRLKELHESGLKLRQNIDERKTANILLSMSAVPDSEMPELPVRIEFNPDDLQQVKNEDLDRLAGNSKRKASDSDSDDEDEDEIGSGDDSVSTDEGNEYGREEARERPDSPKRPRTDEHFAEDDGITDPAALELHRRERNRMHAKRTRVRKKHIMDETSKMIDRLEKQNVQLLDYLTVLEGGKLTNRSSSPATEAIETAVAARQAPPSPSPSPSLFRK